MTITDRTNPVIVGVDGSPSAIRATRWAATDAARRGVPLQIVHLYDWPLTGYPDGLITPPDLHAALAAGSEEILAEARAAAIDAEPDLSVTVTSMIGQCAPGLLTLSGQATLMVVGSRSLGGVTGLILGSIAVALTAHAHCPVIVVRGDREPATGPVVVGVDGSPVSEAAIEFAFDEASAHGVPLVAVHTWHALTAFTDSGIDAIADLARELLAQRLAGWQEKYPDVTVTCDVHRGSATRALLEHADGARVVVVGSRGRGGFAGLSMGSTSQAMIHHAPCPVAVLRSPAGE